MKSSKLKLSNQIRDLLGIKKSNLTYFSKSEISKISNAIIKNDLHYKEALGCVIPNWTEQTTVQTHPSSNNLKAIINALKKASKMSLGDVIKGIDESILSKAEAVSFKNNIITIKLKE